MLNELYQLSVTLKRAGIKTKDWHKDFKHLPNVTPQKPCYRILIGQDGSVAGIEIIEKKFAACLRKWEPSNGNSFPGFNIQPLYRVTDGDNKKLLKKWREGKGPIDLEKIKEWCADKQAKNWDAKFDKKLNKCLGVIPSGLLERCVDIPVEYESVKKLCERVIQWRNACSEKLFNALESYTLASLEKSQNIQSLLPILFHEGSSTKTPEKDRGSISIFMDVPDWKEFPVAHEKTIECINAHLMKASSTDEIESAKGTTDDAFGGLTTGFKEKLPEVKLPVLGGVKLRAMNSESPCQYRYRTIDAKSFLIGLESRGRAKGALEWMKSDEREGQTWGRADGRELIFVYPTILPESPPKLASCLGACKADDTEARFEKYAEDVVASLKGLAPSLKDIELRVFSLRKMDKARTKVVFHRNYSAQRLADAATEWQNGCDNIPKIHLKTWGKEKGEIFFDEPETPFPLQIADCLNRIWKLDGTTKSEVKTIRRSFGIELLLEKTGNQRHVPYLLAVAMQNSKGLFFSLGQSLHGNEVVKPDKFYKHKQLMPAVLGLLLWKLGIRKETYMKNPPYLIGRMLKIADELHALYCKEMRHDSMPPQLLGNALMAGALNSPTQALAQLALRIAPYLGWARTNTSHSLKLSRYFLKEFSLIEAELRGADLPTRLDDAAKAQVLLGYISSNVHPDDNITT